MSFNWVSARSECSIEHILRTLGEVVDGDVKAVNKLLRPGLMFRFSTEAVGKIIVSREVPRAGLSPQIDNVVFERESGAIRVKRMDAQGNNTPLFSATPDLNQEGKCLLEIEGQPFELWQVSRRALERLFFEIA